MRPHSASASRKQRWRQFKLRTFPRGLSVTREGKVYVAVTIGVGFAAVNTGNNLLFLVLGLMLGLIIASGILSELTLRGIHLARRLPQYVDASAAFAVTLQLCNDKKTGSSYAVELRDEIDDVAAATSCFFLRVGSGESREATYSCVLSNRGLAVFTGVMATTRFPFGLFEKRRFLFAREEVTVFPAPLNVPKRWTFTAVSSGAVTFLIAGVGQEFRELREMTPGEDARRIHWPATARIGRPFVREMEAEASGLVEIVLDAAQGPADLQDVDVEIRIRAAATLVRQIITAGDRVRLITARADDLVAHDRIEALVLLRHLALLDPFIEAAGPIPTGSASASILIGPRAQTRGTPFCLNLGSIETNEGRRG